MREALIAKAEGKETVIVFNNCGHGFLDLAAYEARWQTRPAKIQPLVDQGLLTLEGDILRATPRGRLLLNAVIAELLN